MLEVGGYGFLVYFGYEKISTSGIFIFSWCCEKKMGAVSSSGETLIVIYLNSGWTVASRSTMEVCDIMNGYIV